jgi:hypothetical protein
MNPVKAKLLVFRPVSEGRLEFRGWIDVGDVVDDPEKYKFFPAPNGYPFKSEDRFQIQETGA